MKKDKWEHREEIMSREVAKKENKWGDVQTQGEHLVTGCKSFETNGTPSCLRKSSILILRRAMGDKRKQCRIISS